MSNAETLNKAIEKAIEGGWNFTYNTDQLVEFEVLEGIENDWETLEVRCFNKATPQYIDVWVIERLIFKHDFSKGLWGDELIACYECTEGGHEVNHGTDRWARMFEWQYRLQQMVIADNPIDYLKENI